ncbi:MAG: NAD(P)(+) transhydrogenase (Re/Si-specific) subunit beta [Planctomycetes bacterium]|nr:NAD(P)(+) transhydrogenase (Re/Si-specific) subunit beta [Planctomycetota bacterium]
MVAIIMFVMAIKRLSKVRTARGANLIASMAMLLAVVATLANGHLLQLAGARVEHAVVDWHWIVGGLVAGTLVGAIGARLVPMTQMPEMVALLNGSGGAASLLVALAVTFQATSHAAWAGAAPTLATFQAAVDATPTAGHSPIVGATVLLSILIGGITLTGSLIAYGKLSGKLSGNAVVYPGQHAINFLLGALTLGLAGYAVYGELAPGAALGMILGVVALALVLGVLLVIPIGGADMPVVISLLNSYSGVAAAMTGFILENNLLIIAGALVGASGLILTQIMCQAMNRSLASVLLGGFGMTTATGTGGGKDEYKNVKSTTPDELALMCDGVSSVIFVPGYGLAVSQAQHLCRELGEALEAKGATVRYAIHPVAGRMPGHMNVLLAEANVPYEQLVEMEQINSDFKQTDLVIVLGANDVVNPAAIDDPQSPLAGMPILNVHEARNVIVVKRSLSPGYAGVKNPLFELDNCRMLFDDAKGALQTTLQELKAAV